MKLENSIVIVMNLKIADTVKAGIFLTITKYVTCMMYMKRDLAIITLIIVLAASYMLYSYYSKPQLSKKEIITEILKKGENTIKVYSDDFND